jgi:hypothetical protein
MCAAPATPQIHVHVPGPWTADAQSNDLPRPHFLLMDDASQILIPESFIALFVPPGRIKPTASREHMAERYELCEDLACMLTDTCAAMQARDGLAEDMVLERVQAGLRGGDMAVVDDAEAQWVVHRTAELLNWPWP